MTSISFFLLPSVSTCHTTPPHETMKAIWILAILPSSLEGFFIPPQRALTPEKLLVKPKEVPLSARTTRCTTVLRIARGGAGLTTTSWLVPAWTCALAYALYNLFIKKASTIEPLLGGVILQTVAAGLGTLVLSTTTRKALVWDPAGVSWSIAAGVAVGVAELLSFLISSSGVPASQSIPVIIGGSVLLGTVLGRFWLREVLSLRAWCGVGLIAVGIALVGMDGVGH